MKTEVGIRNTQWFVYEELHTQMTTVVSKYRDKTGMLLGATFPIATEILDDPDVEWMLVHMLGDAWRELKRELETRYQYTMEYEYYSLNERSRQWYLEHDGAYARFHGWDLEENFDA